MEVNILGTLSFEVENDIRDHKIGKAIVSVAEAVDKIDLCRLISALKDLENKLDQISELETKIADLEERIEEMCKVG